MTSLLRYPLSPFETLLYGPSYGVLQYLIRSPRPLDPESTWDLLTRDPPPVMDWIRQNYPLPFTCRWALAKR
jgi:hypothetical protein